MKAPEKEETHTGQMCWQTHDLRRCKCGQNPLVCVSVCQMDKTQTLCLKELGTTRPEEILFSMSYLCLSFGSSIIIHPGTCVAVLGYSSANVPEGN